MKEKNDVRDFLLGITHESKAYFTGTTTKNPIGYKQGEEIIFKIRAEASGKALPVPFISYSTQGDDGVKSQGYLEPEDGWFYIKTKLERDGFVHIIAKACDENKNEIEEVDAFDGGAGADVDKIKCETDEPYDYLEFWKALKEKAFSIPKEILFEEKIPAKEGFEAYEVHFATPAGKFVSVVYSYPEGAQEKSLKLLFINMGYGVTNCIPYYRDGYMIVRCNTHDVLNRQPQEYYDNLIKNGLDGYGLEDAENNKKPETSFWYKLFIRDMQAVNYFKNHPLVNGVDFEFEGGSQGAFQAVNLAAHTAIATCVRISVPWFCDIFSAGKQGRIKKGWGPKEEEGLKYFDTAIGGRYLKCPVYIEAGLGDYICPPSGQMALYNGITAPKKLRFVQNRTHPYVPPKVITSEISEGYNQSEYGFCFTVSAQK